MSIAGKRIKVIDVHCHCVVDVAEVVKGTPLAKSAGGGGGNQVLGPQRLQIMDQQGVDVQALTINGYWWYAADRELARRIVQAQNEGLAKWVAAHPDRFVALASVALQHPDLAAEQLEHGVKQLGPARRHDRRSRQRRGCCRCRSSIRSGPRPPSSACWCSCTRAAPTTSSRRARCADAAISATSSATRSRRPTSSRG